MKAMFRKKIQQSGTGFTAPRSDSDSSLSFMEDSDASPQHASPRISRPDPGKELVVDEGSSYELANLNARKASGGKAQPNALFEQDLRFMQEVKKEWDAGIDEEVQQVAGRLAASMHAGGEEEGKRIQTADDLQDLTDPLGFGALSTTTLTIQRELGPEGASNTRQLRKSQRRPEGVRQSQLPTAAQKAALGQLLTTSPGFDPWMYLGTVHANRTKEDLRRGGNVLDETLQQRTGQLRHLVKENFQRFIACKSTIDDIHIKLQENEAFGTAGSTQLVGSAIDDAQREAQAAFQAILERQDGANSVKHKLNLLIRFEKLFHMPARIKQLAADRDFEHVVAEYRKAKTLIPRNDHQLWAALSLRVEDNVRAVQETLLSHLADPHVNQETALTAIQHIELLNTEGLISAAPLERLTQSQKAHMQTVLRAVVTEHVRTMSIVTTYQESAAWKTGEGSRTEGSAGSESECGVLQLVWLDLLKELSRFFTQHAGLLGDLVASASLASFYGKLNRSSDWQLALKGMSAVLREMKGQVQDEINSTLQTLYEHVDSGMAAHIAALTIFGDARRALQGKQYPSIAQMFDEVSFGILKHGVSALARDLASGSSAGIKQGEKREWEAWCIDPSLAGEGDGHRPLSDAMATVNHHICSTLEHYNALTGAALSKCNVKMLDSPRIISSAFFKRLALLTTVIKSHLVNIHANAAADLKAARQRGQLAQLFMVQHNPSRAAALPTASPMPLPGVTTMKLKQSDTPAEAMRPAVKALLLLSNSTYLADHMVLQLFRMHAPLMCPDVPSQQHCQKTAQEVIKQLGEIRKAASEEYVEMQGAMLRASVKHYMATDGTLWDSVPITRHLRNATFDMVYALVVLLHQVTAHAPAYVQPLMSQLCLKMISSIEDYMRSNLSAVGAAGLATFYLEIHFIELTIPKVLKLDAVDAMLDRCYELLLKQLLVLWRKRQVSQASGLFSVLKGVNDKGSESGTLKSMDECLKAFAHKVLPAHIHRASLHFQCFKTLQDSSTGPDARDPSKPPRISLAGQRPSAGQGASSPEDLANLLDTLKADLQALEPLAAGV